MAQWTRYKDYELGFEPALSNETSYLGSLISPARHVPKAHYFGPTVKNVYDQMKEEVDRRIAARKQHEEQNKEIEIFIQSLKGSKDE